MWLVENSKEFECSRNVDLNPEQETCGYIKKRGAILSFLIVYMFISVFLYFFLISDKTYVLILFISCGSQTRVLSFVVLTFSKFGHPCRKSRREEMARRLS